MLWVYSCVVVIEAYLVKENQIVGSESHRGLSFNVAYKPLYSIHSSPQIAHILTARCPLKKSKMPVLKGSNLTQSRMKPISIYTCSTNDTRINAYFLISC